jgi:hypothetical protein
MERKKQVHETWIRQAIITQWGGRRGSYVHRETDEHKANVSPGSMQAYVAFVHQPGGTDERKGLKFVGSAWPTNIS